MHKDPYTFLNQFLPLRLHPKTREIVDETLRNNRPQTDKYYFGLVLMEGTVVGVIKNEMKITVVPTGKIKFLLIASYSFKRYQHDNELHQYQFA